MGKGVNVNDLTACDWELIIAAWVYEQGLPHTMTDFTFDTKSQIAADRDTKIPGFVAFTGQWVADLDHERIERVYQTAMKYNSGKDDLHLPAIKRALDEIGVYSCCCIYAHACYDGLENL